MLVSFFLGLTALNPGHIADPPVRYKLVNKGTVDIAGPVAQQVVLTMAGFVAVTLTDSADGKVAHVVIDSSTFDAGAMTAQLPPQVTESAKGVTLHAFVRNGQLTGPITPSSENVQALQLAPAVQLLLSGMRMAKAGDAWIDSTHADTSAAVGMTKASLVTAWTAKAAAPGSMDFDGTVTGNTAVGGGAMQLDIQTTGTSHVSSVTSGRLPKSAVSNTSGSGTMNMGGQAMTLKVSNEMSVTLIP